MQTTQDRDTLKEIKTIWEKEPNNRTDKIRRIHEIRIWYWRLSNNRRDHASYPYVRLDGMNSFVYSSDIRYERNNRNERVRPAMPSVPYDIQNSFIAFLRQIPAITGPTEKHYEDRFANDLKDLREIYEKLSSRGILFMFETNDTGRKGLIVAAGSIGNALSERPSKDTDGKAPRVMGFVRKWSATKAAANNDKGARMGFEGGSPARRKFNEQTNSHTAPWLHGICNGVLMVIEYGPETSE